MYASSFSHFRSCLHSLLSCFCSGNFSEPWFLDDFLQVWRRKRKKVRDKEKWLSVSLSHMLGKQKRDYQGDSGFSSPGRGRGKGSRISGCAFYFRAFELLGLLYRVYAASFGFHDGISVLLVSLLEIYFFS